MIDIAADRHSLSIAWQRTRAAVRTRVYRWVLYAGVPLFFVACTFTYYGQLNRQRQSDTYGTIYTAVAIVQKQTIWLDSYLPYFQQHGAGENPYALTHGPGGHLIELTPSASSLLLLPVAAVFTAAGVHASDWGAWMEAGMLTAALATAASVAIMFVVLTRLTTRRRAALIAATYAWGTLEWGISGQGLWQHTGASLALSIALLGFIDRRLILAGAALAAMVAFRPSTPIIALFLLPLVGRRIADWARFLLGIAPFALPLLTYNTVVFGSPFHQGYTTSHTMMPFHLRSGRALDGVPGLLFSPGRGLFVYSPVLLFAIAGAFFGRRRLLYVCCFLGAAAYVFAVGNGDQWYGGESFGARKLTDLIPLLTVLLVPAVDAIVRTKWLWAYIALLGWSVFVELLAASATPANLWFNGPHPPDLLRNSIWWNPTDNELVTMVQTDGLWLRMLLMAAIVVCGVVFGRLAAATIAGFRRPVEA
jgi:hypothetical protein